MTRLVVCCDGTWNEPDEVRTGVAAPTNVAKLAMGVAVTDDQKLFYEPGVGTTADERILGGAFGYGLSTNIRNCYRWLAETYRDGDELFLFGFSRGAYTARSLAGLIRNCGILQSDFVDQVDQAFAFYRDRSSHTHPTALASEVFRKMYSHPSWQIHFIGVWDTVGALGIPREIPGMAEVAKLTGWQEPWAFHDTALSSYVDFAYHALAIDEQREPFRPTLWTTEPVQGQTLEQVWFSGVHSEVGGGSKDTSLSDIALLWMVEKATAQGLELEPNELVLGADAGPEQHIAPKWDGPLDNSRTGFYKILHAYHRLHEMPAPEAGKPTFGQSVSSSAVRRRDNPGSDYSPPGLDDYIKALPKTDVVETS